jgi:hypothetical protein
MVDYREEQTYTYEREGTSYTRSAGHSRNEGTRKRNQKDRKG